MRDGTHPVKKPNFRYETMWTVKGGGGVVEMSMFVHVGGGGTYSNVHVVFFPPNFGQKFENCHIILAKI